MNDIASDHVGPDAEPACLGRTDPREHGRTRLERHRDGGTARLRTRNAVAPAERQGGGIREYGPGIGGYRLGHRRSLDADAGQLRACPGASRPAAAVRRAGALHT